MGGGFKGARVGGGRESGSARPETKSAGHEPRLTKGSGAVRPRQKGEEKTAPGPSPLGRHNGVFHGASGGAAETACEKGAEGPLPPAEAPPPPARPAGMCTGLGAPPWRRPGTRGAGRSRRGRFAGAELCAGEERDARGSGEEGGAPGGRGRAAAERPPGRLARGAEGGRLWHGLPEPRRLLSEIRNPAPRSGNPAPARRLPAPSRGPGRPHPLLLPALLRPAGARSHRRKKAENRERQPRRRRRPLTRRGSERIPSRPPWRAACVRVCRALAPCLAHA